MMLSRYSPSYPSVCWRAISTPLESRRQKMLIHYWDISSSLLEHCSRSLMTYEELSQHIIEGTQDAIIFADREGILRLWNAGAENYVRLPF